MEEYVDPDSLVHEKARRQPDVGQSQTSELSPAAVSEKLVAGKRSLFTFKNRLSFKALAIRVIFLVVAFSCFTGYSQQLGDRLMGIFVGPNQLIGNQRNKCKTRGRIAF